MNDFNPDTFSFLWHDNRKFRCLSLPSVICTYKTNIKTPHQNNYVRKC